MTILLIVIIPPNPSLHQAMIKPKTTPPGKKAIAMISRVRQTTGAGSLRASPINMHSKKAMLSRLQMRASQKSITAKGFLLPFPAMFAFIVIIAEISLFSMKV